MSKSSASVRLIAARLQRPRNSAAKNRCRRCNSSNAKADAQTRPPIELLQIIRQQIQANGPMPLSQYMTLCLTHPTLGYYTKLRKDNSHVLGKSGDFITSPDISQVFGELLAVWLLVQWQKQGQPPNIRIVELGPGRGTLLRDMLNAFRSYKGFRENLRKVHLVESSDFLKQEQETLLSSFMGQKDNSTVQPIAKWYPSLSSLPASTEDEFTAVIAHEFFDALPIILLEKMPEGWREVLVEEAPQTNLVSATPQPKLRLSLSPSLTPSASVYGKYPEFNKLPTGTRVELSPETFSAANRIAKLVSSGKGGAALVVDYGDARSYGHSFRGFRNHQIVDPLTEPGNTDLTANVNFNWVKQAVEGDAAFYGPMTQRDFLGNMGIQQRVNMLIKSVADDRAELMLKAAHRLVDTISMGTEYKMAAITPKSESDPPYPFLAAPESLSSTKTAQ